MDLTNLDKQLSDKLEELIEEQETFTKEMMKNSKVNLLGLSKKDCKNYYILHKLAKLELLVKILSTPYNDIKL